MKTFIKRLLLLSAAVFAIAAGVFYFVKYFEQTSDSVPDADLSKTNNSTPVKRHYTKLNIS